MPSIHLTIESLDASVEVTDAQLEAVQERLDAIYADLLADLTNLGMVVDVKRAERWASFVPRLVPDYGYGACLSHQHDRCSGHARSNTETPCACAERGHVRVA